MSIRTSDPGGESSPENTSGSRTVDPGSLGELTQRSEEVPSGPSVGLEKRLFDEPYLFDFFQAVRILQRLGGRSLVGYSGPPGAEAVRFRAHVSLNFPASSIHDLIHPSSELQPPAMIQAFLGLTGPSGVLPRHYTEVLYRLEKDRSSRNPEKHALRDWFDLFNHRFVSLFYRAWEKYRFFVPFERGQYRRPEPDLFTGCLYSLVGLGVPALRNRLQVSLRSGAADGELEEQALARIENLALLRYGGLLAQQVRSAAGLQAMLQDYFQLPVKVHQYQGQWLKIEPSQQSRLQDGGNNRLGLTSVIGEQVWDIQSKFRLRIGPLEYEQFLDFLPDLAPIPDRKGLFLLFHLVKLYVGPALDFDVQLVLMRSEVPDCQLEEGIIFGARLGWNTWLRSEEHREDPEDAVFEGNGSPLARGKRTSGRKLIRDRVEVDTSRLLLASPPGFQPVASHDACVASLREKRCSTNRMSVSVKMTTPRGEDLCPALRPVTNRRSTSPSPDPSAFPHPRQVRLTRALKAETPTTARRSRGWTGRLNGTCCPLP